MSLPEIDSAVPKEGLRWKNAHHLVLMWTPNLLNPRKLLRNIRQPFTEVLHTNHKQYAVAMIEGVEYHVVEHGMGLMDMAIDVVTPDVFPKGFIPRVKQLFRIDFYYGHDKYFPHPFRLIARSAEGTGSDAEKYVNQILEQERQKLITTR